MINFDTLTFIGPVYMDNAPARKDSHDGLGYFPDRQVLIASCEPALPKKFRFLGGEPKNLCCIIGIQDVTRLIATAKNPDLFIGQGLVNKIIDKANTFIIVFFLKFA